MKVWKNTLLAGALALATFALPAMAQPFTTDLKVKIGAESSLVVGTTADFVKGAAAFADYAGKTTLDYKVRTSTGGSGSITAAVGDFSGTGGPPLTDLTFVSNPTTGTTGGTLTAKNAAQAVITFGQKVHSSKAGAKADVNWTLVNDPAVETGTYTSTVTFTISAS